jgi:hypothetical protein
LDYHLWGKHPKSLYDFQVFLTQAVQYAVVSGWSFKPASANSDREGEN